MRMKNIIFMNLCSVCIISYSLWGAESDARRGSPVMSSKRIIDGNSCLTPDRNFFQYQYRYIGDTAQCVDVAIRSFSQTTKEVGEFLQNNSSLTGGMYKHLSAWGGLYSHMPELTGKKDAIDTFSAPYVLSLMFRARFSDAESAAKNILSQKTDDYGATLLLGLLSVYNKENFPYLERAFVMNPYKTMWVFDWHFSRFRIEPKEEWDFAHAYFSMLARHKQMIRELKLPPRVAQRLSMGFYVKYEDSQNPFPGYKEIEPGMRGMISLIRVNLQLERMPQMRGIEEKKTRIVEEIKRVQ